VDGVAWVATGNVEEVTAKLEACAVAAGEWAQANAVGFDEGKTEAVLFRKGRKEMPAGKIQVGNHKVAYNKEATRWLGVYLGSSLTLKEHHRTRMRKARQAEGRLRRHTGQFGLTPEHCRRIQVACVQASALFGSKLWWTNGRGVKGQANDIKLMVNRQARSTTGCYKSTNSGALVAEAGLDNRQRRFALRLAGLPSSVQARFVVGAKDAFGQQLERALWTPTSSPGPLEATTLMTTVDHLFGEVIIEDTDAAATRTANGWQGDGDLDGRITARGWLRRLRSRTVPPRARRVDRSAGPHGQEPGGLRS